jgi:hypothetical protein
MHRSLTALLFAAAIAPASARAEAPQFRTEQAAKDHCPKDIVVWLDAGRPFYYLPGTRWYGKTIGGAYVCKREADVDGDRLGPDVAHQ